MGQCVSKDDAHAGAPHRLNERQSLDHISDLYKKAFGKTSAGLPVDLDFFLPDTGPLSNDSYRSRLVTSNGTQILKLPQSGVQVRYAFVSQRGYYPDAVNKANQDALCVKTSVAGEPDSLFFGVFDGHGQAGTECAQYARDQVYMNMMADANYFSSPAEALERAMVKTNDQLHAHSIDDTLSGTTAVGVLMKGKQLFVANVGDSRCVLASREPDGIAARDLSRDQTPFRKDEMERVKQYGARVLTLEQLDGLKDPNIQDWGTEEEDTGDPPRLWHPSGSYPGTAFTRSLGDHAAEEIGVIGHPEIETLTLSEKDAFLVIATDGVWEFLSSQTVVEMADKYNDPQEGCLAIAVESYKAWLATEARTDDITIIIVAFQLGSGLSISKTPSSASLVDSRNASMRGPSIKRLASQKSLRKGLARGSLAMVDTPSFRGEPVAVSIPAANGGDGEEYMVSGGIKSSEEVAYLRGILASHPQFMRLAPEAIAQLIDVFVLRYVDEGDVLVEQGQPGNHFFVVKEGTFALKMKQQSDTGEAEVQTVHRYAPASDTDSCFGEIALVSGSKPYGGNIIARSAGQVWQLDRRAYKKIVAGNTPRATADM